MVTTPILFDRDADILIGRNVMLDGYAGGGVERISPKTLRDAA